MWLPYLRGQARRPAPTRQPDLNVSVRIICKLLGKDTGAKCRLFSVRILTFAIVKDSEITKLLQQFVVIQQVGGVFRMADSLLIDKVGFKNNPAISFERFSNLGKQRPLQIIEIYDQVIGVCAEVLFARGPLAAMISRATFSRRDGVPHPERWMKCQLPRHGNLARPRKSHCGRFPPQRPTLLLVECPTRRYRESAAEKPTEDRPPEITHTDGPIWFDHPRTWLLRRCSKAFKWFKRFKPI